MTVLVESMRRIVLPKYAVRVWRRQVQDYQHEAQGLTDVELVAYQYQEASLRELCDRLMEIDRVTAVEVIDWNQNGIVLTNQERRTV